MRSLGAVDESERMEGDPWPLGATWVESEQGFNFALFSRYATSVTLSGLVKDDPGASSLSGDTEKTGFRGKLPRKGKTNE